MKNIIFVVREVGYTWEEVIVPYMEVMQLKMVI